MDLILKPAAGRGYVFRFDFDAHPSSGVQSLGVRFPLSFTESNSSVALNFNQMLAQCRPNVFFIETDLTRSFDTNTLGARY